MIQRVCVVNALLAVCALAPVWVMALNAEPTASPVEDVKRAADRTQRLQGLLREALEAKRNEEARKLAQQLREATAAERAILQRLRDQWREAKRQGKTDEANRLGRLLGEAARNAEYARSLATSRLGPAPLDVVISEVCYWPKDGEHEWVELANTSDEPVDVSGWVLLDGQTLNYSLPDKLPAVPPKGFVLVVFDGTGAAPSPFDKDVKAIVHTAPGLKGDVLGDRGGHLALYSPGEYGPQPGMTTMRSYLAWGLSPGTVLTHAIAAGRWRRAEDVPRGAVPPPRGATPGRWMERGGSIGLRVPLQQGRRLDCESWLTFASSEATPGKSNGAVRRSPRPNLPRDGSRLAEGQKTMLSCVGLDEKVTYQFQVCLDKDCTQVRVEARDLDEPYYILKALPPNSTSYWRVRAIYADGSASPWSVARSIVCGYPK